MLPFRTPEVDDLPALRDICENYGTMGCDLNPVGIYIWREAYGIRVCFRDGFLLLAYFKPDGKPWGYSFPIGEGNPAELIDEIFADASERGCEAEFVMLTDAQAQKLSGLTRAGFTFSEVKAAEDYIYSCYDLCTLPGKKYHAKRNHISKFDRSYPDWSFTIINKENKSDALEVARLWDELRGENPEENEEFTAIRETLENYETLKIHGAILYVGDKPVAMTMGSKINRKTFDVMFEKALTEYEGSYAKINNEFAKTLVGFEFINREEDMGLESLRKSKLSYHPVVVLRRFRGVRNA